MGRHTRIEFLDDDHVLRVLRLLLSHGAGEPSVPGFFAPERVDLAPLSRAGGGGDG